MTPDMGLSRRAQLISLLDSTACVEILTTARASDGVLHPLWDRFKTSYDQAMMYRLVIYY